MMRHMQIICGICLIGALSLGGRGAEEKEASGDPWAVKSVEAVRAKAIYDAALTRIQRMYDIKTRRIESDNAAAVDRACVLLHSALDNVIRRITQSGDLDRAILIREMKQDLEKTGVIPTA